MAQAFPLQPGAIQMTDGELDAEAARSRSVGLISVLAVAMYTGFVFSSWLALRDAAAGDHAKRLAAIYEHKLAFIASGFFVSVASLLVGAVLVHLMLAARSRSEQVSKFAVYSVIVGPVVVAMIFPVYVLAQVAAANDFADAATQSVALANHLSRSGLASGSTAAYQLGQLLMGIAWVVCAIFATRIGLLTRLVGAVAAAIGAANVIAPPLAGLLSVFWIGAFAIMMLGESAQIPPAWKLGRPVPWREVAAVGQAEQESAAEQESQAEQEYVAQHESPEDFNKPGS